MDFFLHLIRSLMDFFLYFFHGFFSSFFPLIDGSRLMASLMDTNQWRWGIRLYRVIHCNPIGFFFHFHFHLHFHLRSEIKSLHSSFQIALQPIVFLVKMFKIIIGSVVGRNPFLIADSAQTEYCTTFHCSSVRLSQAWHTTFLTYV